MGRAGHLCMKPRWTIGFSARYIIPTMTNMTAAKTSTQSGNCCAGHDHEVSWADISPGEHVVQIYENDQVLLDALEGFIIGGLRSGESVVAIASAEHRLALNQRLESYGVNARDLRSQFICLDAEQTLAKFMVLGWPDEELFTRLITETLERARKGGRRVRAFGEMVAILWETGHSDATVQLENLWNKFCHARDLSLFCAYPKKGFTSKSTSSLKEICAAHSKVIAELDWLPA